MLEAAANNLSSTLSILAHVLGAFITQFMDWIAAILIHNETSVYLTFKFTHMKCCTIHYFFLFIFVTAEFQSVCDIVPFVETDIICSLHLYRLNERCQCERSVRESAGRKRYPKYEKCIL